MFVPATPSTERRMREELYKESEAVAEDERHLRGWLSKRPHLPQVDDLLLERFLYGCKYSLSRCKAILDMHYTIKGAVPEIYKNRDPTAEDIRQSCKVSLVTVLPRLTPAVYRVFVHRIADPDADKLNVWLHSKRTFMLVDLLLQAENVLACIIIIDLENTTWYHVMKAPLLLLKKLTLCLQNYKTYLSSITGCVLLRLMSVGDNPALRYEKGCVLQESNKCRGKIDSKSKDAYPMRIKEFHFVNAPTFVYKILDIIRPLLKKKLNERIHVHCNGLENLYKSVPAYMLPEEYSGDEESIKYLSDAMQQTLESHKDWFMAEELKVADESKRLGKEVEYGELFGVEGSFRMLTID